MFVGVTLLYKSEENSVLYGILKSYTIDCNGYLDLQGKVAEKVKEQLVYYPAHKYIGVEDVFTVSNKAQKEEMLGRTSYFELETKEEVDNLLDDTEVLDIYRENREKGFFNTKLLYYYQGVESFVFSILTIVELYDESQIIENIFKLANSESFKNKVVELSIDGVILKDIEFIGIEEFAVVEEDLRKGGAYQVLYNNEFNEEDIALPELEEIQEICNDIFLTTN